MSSWYSSSRPQHWPLAAANKYPENQHWDDHKKSDQPEGERALAAINVLNVQYRHLQQPATKNKQPPQQAKAEQVNKSGTEVLDTRVILQ